MTYFGGMHSSEDEGWKPISAPIFRKLLITGGWSSNEPVMRRRTAKGWEYRAMTPVELEQYAIEEAW